MGINVSNGSGKVKFLNINMKNGHFSEGSKENKINYEPGRVAVEGIPYRLTVEEDTYEDQKGWRATLYLHDTTPGEPNLAVSWNICSGATGVSSQGTAFLARLYACDTRQPVSIKPWAAKAGEKLGDSVMEHDFAAVAVRQMDQTGKWVSVKADYLGADKLPPTREVKIPGAPKPVLVKEGWEDIMAGLVEQISQRLKAENPRDGQQQSQNSAAHDDSGGIDPADIAREAEAAAAAEGFRARA